MEMQTFSVSLSNPDASWTFLLESVLKGFKVLCKKKHFCEILKWFILKHVEDFLLEKAILFYILTTDLFVMFSIIDQWY